MNKYVKSLIIFITAALCVNLAYSYLCFAATNQTGVPFNMPLRKKLKEEYTSIELKGGVKVDQEKQVIDLNLRESDLRQVLRMLADKAGKNIILHDGVSGTLTLDLVNVELNRAIEYIMTIKELTYWKDGNTLIVANNEDAQNLNINLEEVRGIKIKHIDASRVAEFLNTNIFNLNRPSTSKSAIVTTNPSSNEILIFGSEEDIEMAKKVVDYLDVKPNMTNFTVNYADPTSIASKICWTAFKSSDGEQNFSREADLAEGSEISIVCGQTNEPEESADGDFTSFKTPAYWVLADTGLNQITIYGGTQEQLNLAQEIIDNYDKREPQVYMEISIIELNESGSQTLSNILNYTTASGDTISFTGGTTTFPAFEIFGGQQSHTTDNSSLVSTIEAVIEENKGRVLANPRIIAANNTQSEINITSDIIDTTTQTVETVGSNTVTTTNYNKGSQGIQFNILPKVSPSGYVTLTIEPSYDSIKSQITDAGEIKATLLNTRDLKVKNVRVRDGETLVLGGLIQENETISHKKVPFLGDLPIIGVLFQDQGTSKTRSELIIMVTPRIIYDPDQIVENI